MTKTWWEMKKEGMQVKNENKNENAKQMSR